MLTEPSRGVEMGVGRCRGPSLRRCVRSGIHSGMIQVGAPLSRVVMVAAALHGCSGTDAAALKLAVVHLEGIERGELRVCGVQGAATGFPTSDEEARRVDREELRALFGARGVLREVAGAGRGLPGK